MARNKYIRGLFIMMIVALLSLLGSCSNNETEKLNQETDSKAKDGWTLTFEDDFSGETLDTSKWEHAPEWERHRGKWSNQDAYLNGEGQLVIQISERDGDYYSGAIRSAGLFEQAYGYFEMRAKLPTEPGFWTAFWLMSDSVHDVTDNGKNGTEIDIFESPAARHGKIDHALHWNGYEEQHKSKSKTIKVPEVYEDYATFALEWNEEEYIFYINDKETWRTSAGGVSQAPAYLKITAEIGDWAGNIAKANLPAHMLVDYVRVYQRK